MRYQVELGPLGFVVRDTKTGKPMLAPQSALGARSDGLFSGRPQARLYAESLNHA